MRVLFFYSYYCLQMFVKGNISLIIKRIVLQHLLM